jgi:hypothetical protein
MPGASSDDAAFPRLSAATAAGGGAWSRSKVPDGMTNGALSNSSALNGVVAQDIAPA